MTRLAVRKTYKLFIGGVFPRSESGRTIVAEGANVARASRKDLRDAVRIARQAGVDWAKATAYNRGQVVYRIAEMMETRRSELAALASSAGEVDRAIDRVVWYAGWADKLAQVVGGANPVAGPYFKPLLGLVSRLAPVIVGGNTAVVIASEAHPLVAIELAECLATADVPPGVVNILTGLRKELAPVLASHMDVAALDLTGGDGDAAELERLGAENVKRVVRGKADGQSPYDIAAFLELKTVWHPIGM